MDSTVTEPSGRCCTQWSLRMLWESYAEAPAWPGPAWPSPLAPRPQGRKGGAGPPLQVAVDAQGHLLLLARVVQMHAAGEAQLVLGQAQLLEGLL